MKILASQIKENDCVKIPTSDVNIPTSGVNTNTRWVWSQQVKTIEYEGDNVIIMDGVGRHVFGKNDSVEVMR